MLAEWGACRHGGAQQIAGRDLGHAPLPRQTRLRVSDLAGHSYAVPVTFSDQTPLQVRGLRDMQMLSGTLRPGPRHVGSVSQDLAALLAWDADEYGLVAAHQARLVLYHAALAHRLAQG